MKIDTKEHIDFIIDLMSNYDQHKEVYVDVTNLELGTSTRSGGKDGKWITVEVNCLKLTGITKNYYGEHSGTRYIYEEDTVYIKLLELYYSIILNRRNDKINSLL